jgi:hypothetical protein
MSLDWRRLIDLNFDIHSPWLCFASPEQQGQILAALGTIGWFALAFQLSSTLGKHSASLAYKLLSGFLYSLVYYLCATRLSFIFCSISALLPWVILSQETANRPSAIRKAGFLCAGLLVSIFSSIFAPLVVGLVLLLSHHSYSKLKYPALSAVVFVYSCIIYSTAPTLGWPDLPAFARFIPDDGLPGLIRPLLGPGIPAPILNHQALTQATATFSLALALTLITLLFAKAEWRWSLEAKVLSLLTTLVLLHTLSPASIFESLPIQAIGRIVPGWFEQPLVLIFLAILFTFSLRALLANSSSLILRNFIPLVLILGLPRGEAQPVKPVTAVSSTDLSWAGDSQINPAARRFQCVDRTVVPNLRNSQFVSIAPFVQSINFSRAVAPKNLGRVMDKNLKTRWSSKSAGQHGTEWIKIKFREPLLVEGIELHTGKFRSDFPRGLLVLDCSSKEKTILFQDINWQGALEYTQSGVPHLLNQSNVKVPICNPNTVDGISCILIEQTSTNPTFDWSVAEINIAIKPRN